MKQESLTAFHDGSSHRSISHKPEDEPLNCGEQQIVGNMSERFSENNGFATHLGYETDSITALGRKCKSEKCSLG
jgi:hypothetical protein